jgi:hypothetical protein
MENTKPVSEKCVQNIIDTMTLSGIEMELRMADRFETSPEYIAELKEAKKRMTPKLHPLAGEIGSRLLPQGF